MQSTGRRAFKPRRIDKTIIEVRFLELVRAREDTKHCSHITIFEDCKARWIYSLSRIDITAARYICNWMIGRFIGEPTKCLICNETECHNTHMMICGRVGDIHRLGGGRKWRQALSELRKLFSCAQTMANLVPELDMILEGIRDDPSVELRIHS